jgi:4-amino-4-deoxychorismate lyase
MYLLFESIRFEDGEFHNMDLHQARVNRTFSKLFSGYEPVNLESIVREIKPVIGVYKCRISYNHESKAINLSPYTKKPPSSLKIVSNNSIKYDFKYEDRTELDRLYKLRSRKDDILIVKNQLISDTSYGNICLVKKGKWFTPFQPLLQGTQREYAIRKNWVAEKDISINELFTYDHFMVINAMLPFDTNRAEPINQVYL